MLLRTTSSQMVRAQGDRGINNKGAKVQQAMAPYNIPLIGFMFLPINGFENWPYLLSPGQNGHTYNNISLWWDSFCAT
uniref:Uncharacterized protein n=1 Tax=Romanomermis culicivorax TaxID=13658 RepID=A0A915L3E3_ROMCU